MTVALTYRTSGAWGSGKGSNLTPTEVDENFWDLQDALNGFLATLPTPVGISHFTVTASTFTVTLSDSTVYGPFALPVAAFNWQDDWTAGTTYSPLDLFIYPGDGLYLVLDDYEAPTEFDPDVTGTNGKLLQKLIGFPAEGIVDVLNKTTDYTISSADKGRYLRMNSAAETDPIYVLVPSDDDAPDIPVGFICSIRQVGPGALYVDAATTTSPVIIHTPEGYQARKQGSQLTLVKVGGNEWDLSGDLALVP